MGKLRDGWRKMTFKERCCNSVGFLCNLAVVVLALLQLCNVWEDAAYAYLPLMCISMTVQAIRFGRKSGGPFWIFAAMAVMLAVATVVLCFL